MRVTSSREDDDFPFKFDPMNFEILKSIPIPSQYLEFLELKKNLLAGKLKQLATSKIMRGYLRLLVHFKLNINLSEDIHQIDSRSIYIAQYMP